MSNGPATSSAVNGSQIEDTFSVTNGDKVSSNFKRDLRKRRNAFCSAAKSWRHSPIQRLAENVENVAARTYTLTKLALSLLGYLGVGYKWMTAFSWLMLYTACLLPGFLNGVCYYFLSGRVLRSIPYGNYNRNTLDLYMPKTAIRDPKPVVIFVTGGAWIIGYKAWGTLLGWALSDNDVIVVSIDYRNFPQGCISDMVADVSGGIAWTFRHIANYGGDPKRISLVCQSAGAHISSLALLNMAQDLSSHASTSFSGQAWNPAHLKSFIGISGAYEIPGIIDYLDRRGLGKSILLKIMGGEESLQRNSPTCRVREAVFTQSVSRIPPVFLFHGTDDISVPFSSSVEFALALEAAGAQVECTVMRDKTHTDLVIQDLMRGGADELLEHILSIALKEGDKSGEITWLARKRMLPEFLIQMARFASPF